MTVQRENKQRGCIVTARRLQPLRQGELDGLCGLYAVVNACGSCLPIRWN